MSGRPAVAAPRAPARQMLRMEGISKAYGAVRANRDIDLVVPAGRIVGLLGENGSGKTWPRSSARRAKVTAAERSRPGEMKAASFTVDSSLPAPRS
jgi:ATPase subunit of ABC transporter with duplicated ATPase domains